MSCDLFTAFCIKNEFISAMVHLWEIKKKSHWKMYFFIIINHYEVLHCNLDKLVKIKKNIFKLK